MVNMGVPPQFEQGRLKNAVRPLRQLQELLGEQAGIPDVGVGDGLPRIRHMRVAEEQDGALLLKTPIRIMDPAFTGRQADLVKILPAVNAGGMVVLLYLEYLEPFELELAVEYGDGLLGLCSHRAKLRNSNIR